MFPLGVGVFLKLEALKPLEAKNFKIPELIALLEEQISSQVQHD
jgi:1-acyl-sn-glycerol-3-phosphate acyltransferase